MFRLILRCESISFILNFFDQPPKSIDVLRAKRTKAKESNYALECFVVFQCVYSHFHRSCLTNFSMSTANQATQVRFDLFSDGDPASFSLPSPIALETEQNENNSVSFTLGWERRSATFWLVSFLDCHVSSSRFTGFSLNQWKMLLFSFMVRPAVFTALSSDEWTRWFLIIPFWIEKKRKETSFWNCFDSESWLKAMAIKLI